MVKRAKSLILNINMRNLVKILVFLITLSSFSQNGNKAEWFIGGSVDMSMAIWGPYNNKPNDIGTTFNGEFSFGWQKRELFNNFPARISHKVEIHPAIDNYVKVTWVAVDYWLEDHLLWFEFEGFNQYAGVEMFNIYRENPYYDPTDPNNYMRNANSLISPGVNAELQYRFNDQFAIASGINVFRAESVLIKDGKQVRWDVMVTAYLYL